MARTPRNLAMDFDKVEIADMEDLEAFGGVSFQEVLDAFSAAKASGGVPPMKYFRPISFLALRQSDPAATWDDAGHVQIGELNLAGRPAAAPLAPLNGSQQAKARTARPSGSARARAS